MIAAYWLERCYDLALSSPDPSNQNGAIVVGWDGERLGESCNCFTPGVQVTPELLADRDWKIAHIEHAERAAIYDAGDCNGATMYCPWAPCCDCARAIALSGIGKLVVHGKRLNETPARWLVSVEQGMGIVRAAGVEIEVFDGELIASPVLVNGKLWQP